MARTTASDSRSGFAILGLDNDILVCGLASPMISSVDPDTEAIGRCAAQTLFDLIEKPSLAQRRIVRQVDPVRVVERASTEVYPLEPPWLSDALVFIGRHIGDNLTASDVYRRVGFSHAQVDKIFRAKLGTSVQKTTSEMQLEKAQRLLMSTRWPMRLAGRLRQGIMPPDISRLSPPSRKQRPGSRISRCWTRCCVSR